MRLYFVRIFPMLFAIGILYHLRLIDCIEEVPYTEIHWRKDLQKQDTFSLKGELLFRQNCASCHPYKVEHQMPASNLRGVQQRWANYPPDDLVQFIRAPDSLLQSQHPRALKLLRERYSMPGFPELDDHQIKSILYFLDQQLDR